MKFKITFKRLIRFLELSPTIATHIKAIWNLVKDVVNKEMLEEINKAANERIKEDDKHSHEK